MGYHANIEKRNLFRKVRIRGILAKPQGTVKITTLNDVEKKPDSKLNFRTVEGLSKLNLFKIC